MVYVCSLEKLALFEGWHSKHSRIGLQAANHNSAFNSPIETFHGHPGTFSSLTARSNEKLVQRIPALSFGWRLVWKSGIKPTHKA
jgi:hypothetical protein